MSRRVAVIEDEFALRENYADVLTQSKAIHSTNICQSQRCDGSI